jgi:branched-chain amino acid transport system ATP-binding protein
MALLEVDSLTIRFGGLTALGNLSLAVERGSITSIIGPNGAGKTTLFNCINGLYKPTSGRIVFDGTEIQGKPPHRIAALGIARTFQNIELFSHVSTMNNLMLGRHLRMRTGIFSGAFFFSRRSRAGREEVAHRDRVEDIIDFLDLQSARNMPVGALPYGRQKIVELGRALALEPQLLLLDEPTAGMNLEEKQDLLFWMNDIRDELGVTLLLIEHDMRVVLEVSEKIYALNFGELIAAGTPEEVAGHPEVIKAYLGED